MVLRFLWSLGWVILLASAAPVPGAEESLDEEEKTLQNAGLKTDTTSLLQFFRDRTPTPADREQLAALVRKLGDAAFEVRERAAAELVKQGRFAVAVLQRAVTDPDVEVARRAEKCLEVIGSGAEKDRVRAATRLLGARRPAGAAAPLLDYLPQADDELAEDLQRALDAVGLRDGKADPALVAALTDRELVRRAAAAQVVGRSPQPAEQAAVRRLLTDADTRVRLRAAQGLAAGGQKDALPVLVALLADAPFAVAQEAEAFLLRAAGDGSPNVALGPHDTERRQCREAWHRWWTEQGGRIDLAKIDWQRRMPRFPAIPPFAANRMPDVIFVPTPQDVVEKMLELAKVKRGDVVYDLGCGDGRIVVTAAKKYGAHGFGVDIDPQRVKDSLENVQKNGVQKLVTIKQADVFTLDLREANVICLYLLPSLNVKLIPQLEKCKPGTRILSHSFDMRGVKPDQVVQVRTRDGGERTVYLWTTPLKKE